VEGWGGDGSRRFYATERLIRHRLLASIRRIFMMMTDSLCMQLRALHIHHGVATYQHVHQVFHLNRELQMLGLWLA
jgi:hypothetical protein